MHKNDLKVGMIIGVKHHTGTIGFKGTVTFITKEWFIIEDIGTEYVYPLEELDDWSKMMEIVNGK